MFLFPKRKMDPKELSFTKRVHPSLDRRCAFPVLGLSTEAQKLSSWPELVFPVKKQKKKKRKEKNQSRHSLGVSPVNPI